MKAVLKWLALLAGLVLLAWYLSRLDSAAVLPALKQLGWLAPLVLVPYFIVYIVDCFAWRLAFPEKPCVSFLTMFRIRWAGESLNNLVPSAYIGGEALKVYLLQKQGVRAEDATASAVVSKTAQTVAQVFFISLAALTFLSLVKNNAALRAGMIVVVACGMLAVAALFWIQRRGLLGVLFSITQAFRLRSRALEAIRPKIEQVDRTILDFYRRHPRRFLASTCAYLCGFFLDTTEIYLASHLLGMPIAWWQAFCVEAFTGVAKILGMWAPGSIGVQESGIVLLGRLGGLPDTLSFTYALLRRVREGIFVLGGWTLLYVAETASWRRAMNSTQKDRQAVDLE